mmetsp:Transcript_25212/g.38806  ORF Transcript_25212/g.38806 Transcript_25212/m.38806 type:complete len:324 (+) Transcript_25212:50-1021(+)
MGNGRVDSSGRIKSPKRFFTKWFKRSSNDDSVINTPAQTLYTKVETCKSLTSKSESHVHMKSRYTPSIETPPPIVRDEHFFIEDVPWDELILETMPHDEPQDTLTDFQLNTNQPQKNKNVSATKAKPNSKTTFVTPTSPKACKTKSANKKPKKDSQSVNSSRSIASSIASFRSKNGSRSINIFSGNKKSILGNVTIRSASSLEVENNNKNCNKPLTRKNSPTRTEEYVSSDQESAEVEDSIQKTYRDQSLITTGTSFERAGTSVDESTFFERTATPFSALTYSTYGDEEETVEEDPYKAYIVNTLACSAANSAIFEDLLCIGD